MTPKPGAAPTGTTSTPPASPMAVPDPTTPLSPVEAAKPTVLVSAVDAYIHERMQAQPATLEEALAATHVQLREGMHRMSLPDYFEGFSYDCTQGLGCKAHTWHQVEVQFADGAKLQRWEYDHGRKDLIFKWVPKDQRVIDSYINRYGWMFVNRQYFGAAPAHLFTANGGIQVGGDILMFLPAKRALEIRGAGAQRSRDLLRGRLTPGKSAKQVMMGSPDNPNQYMPKVDAESQDEVEVAPGPGALVEGRDF